MSLNTAAILSRAPVFGCTSGLDDHPGMISLDGLFDDFIFTGNGLSDGGTGRGQVNTYDPDDYLSGDDENDDEDEDEGDKEGAATGGRRKKRGRGLHRNMSEDQKVERRERNREHAKRSRVRKKFLLDSLQQSVHALQEENEKLKVAIRQHLVTDAESLLSSCMDVGPTVIARNSVDATMTLDDPDYSLVKALQTAQQNFVISDPSLPDNPIVYASQGFLALTGYKLDQGMLSNFIASTIFFQLHILVTSTIVLGRNCRFLQGPETDPHTVDQIRRGIEKGEDTTVCLLNYRSDGSKFWNQFFVAALRDANGNTVNFLGVQCKVSEDYAIAFSQF